jgi:hypothetical protein
VNAEAAEQVSQILEAKLAGGAIKSRLLSDALA